MYSSSSPKSQLERPNNRDMDELRIWKQDGFFGVTLPIMFRVEGANAATALYYTAPFFIATRDYYLISITERHEVKGSDAGAVSLQLYKVPSGTAPLSGTTMLSSALNLKSTANTNQDGILATNPSTLLIPRGYALSFITTGTLTAVQGVTVAVLLKAV